MVSEWKQLKLSSSLLVVGTKCLRDFERVRTSRDRIKKTLLTSRVSNKCGGSCPKILLVGRMKVVV